MNNQTLWIGVSVAVAAVAVAATALFFRRRKPKPVNPVQCSFRVTGLYFYPIKSCAGIPMTTGTIARYGFEYDRQRMIINGETNRFVTQRQNSKLAIIKTDIRGNFLVLDAPGMDTLKIPLTGFEDPTAGAVRKVSVWSDECEGLDEGDVAATWLQTFLQTPNLRLVRIPENHSRKTPDKYQVSGAENVVAYSDGYPFLIASEASLRDLNKRIGGESNLPIHRFRPNIIVEGDEGFIEDSWKKIKIGDVILDVVKPCTRCKVTTIDQLTGQVPSVEPLNTLKTFRTGISKGEPEGICFGANATHESTGTLAVGAQVQVLEYYDGETVVKNY